MTVTRDIVTDLLPLYAAGEASADSRAAVESALREDATLRRLVEALKVSGSMAVPGEPTSGRQALTRAKGLVRRRASLFGAACFFTAYPLAFSFDSQGVHFLVLRASPAIVVAALAAAATFWIRFAIVSRKAKVTGL